MISFSLFSQHIILLRKKLWLAWSLQYTFAANLCPLSNNSVPLQIVQVPLNRVFSVPPSCSCSLHCSCSFHSFISYDHQHLVAVFILNSYILNQLIIRNMRNLPVDWGQGSMLSMLRVWIQSLVKGAKRSHKPRRRQKQKRKEKRMKCFLLSSFILSLMLSLFKC